MKLYAALLAYYLGSAALAGNAPGLVCAALLVPLIAWGLAPHLASDPTRTRKTGLLLGLVAALAADAATSLTLTAASQRGPVVRLAWSLLAGSAVWFGIREGHGEAAALAGWKRWSDREWSWSGAWLGALVAIGLGAAFLAFSVRYYPLGPDAGVNVSHGIRVAEGLVPYVDFETVYHPGNCYLQALWHALLGPPTLSSLRLQIVLQHAIVMAGLGLVLRLRLGLGGVPLAVLLSTYAFLVPALEGLFLVLEPMISMCGWLALATASALGSRLRRPGDIPVHERVGLGFLSGALACLALAVKQPGGVFLVAIPLVHVDAGRLDRSVLAGQLLGFAFVPALFFGAHPGALPHYWENSVGKLFSYAQGELAPKDPLATSIEVLARNALVPLAMLAGLSVCDRTNRGDALLMLAGLLTLGPTLLRPFLHYYLLPSPFACLAIGLVARRAAPLAQRRPWLVPLGLASAAFGLVPFLQYHKQTFGRDAGAAHQAEVTAFIAARSQGHDRLLILPNTPEYYVLTGTRSPDGVYSFVDNRRSLELAAERFRLAREGRLPAFVVDRGCPVLDDVRARLRQLGWIKRAEGPNVEHWVCE